MSKFKYIMWDWNGTILDDLQANFDTINKLLSDRNLPSMESLEQYRDLFGFPVINFYEKIPLVNGRNDDLNSFACGL